MTTLNQREERIQQIRKVTPWREFLKEICSRRPLTFYKHDGIISKFPPSSRIAWIQSSKQYEAMRDDLLWYGISYEEWKDFFDQFQKLFLSFPQEAMMQFGDFCENTSYGDVVHNWKNVYMWYFIVFWCEDVMYTFVARENCKRVFNSVMVFKNSENVYYSNWIISSFKIFYSKFCTDSNNLWFCTNMQWCSNCLLCDNLTNKSYCIANKEYSKEEYQKEYKRILSMKEKYPERFTKLNTQATNFWSIDVTGSFVIDSENVEEWYFSYNVKWWRNIVFQWWETTNEEVYDVFIWWAKYSNHLYWVQWSGSSEHAYFCNVWVNNNHVFYCIWLDSCSYCFGCIGLRNKSYCILNKQYEKEEWHRIVNLIFTSMESNWTLWTFFPWRLCPYNFNDSASMLLDDSFTKAEVEADWFMRRDEEIKIDIPEWMDVVSVDELHEYESMKEWIFTIDPVILKKVIKDEDWDVYRIVKMEYDFLVKYGLPLPRMHWLQRLKGHFKR